MESGGCGGCGKRHWDWHDRHGYCDYGDCGGGGSRSDCGGGCGSVLDSANYNGSSAGRVQKRMPMLLVEPEV